MKDANAAVNTTVKMALKIQALNGIRTHNLCVSGAMLNQLSNQNHMGAVVSEFGHFMFSGHNTRLKYINSMEIDVQQQQFNYTHHFVYTHYLQPWSTLGRLGIEARAHSPKINCRPDSRERRKSSLPPTRIDMLLNYRFFLLFISGHIDCYLPPTPVTVNISNLHPLFIPIQRGNHAIEIFM